MVALASSDLSEVELDRVSLTFNSSNWSAVQLVTLRGVDDADLDGPVQVDITVGPATSPDTRYSGATGEGFTIANEDDDTTMVLVKTASGAVTSERGGATQLQLTLSSRPTAAVTLRFASSDSSEGALDDAALTFAPDAWDVAQAISARGVDDGLLDGPVEWAIEFMAAESLDANWSGLVPGAVSFTNADDELQQLTRQVGPNSRHPTLSADGTRVAFSSEIVTPNDGNDQGADLFIGDVLAGTYQNVTAGCANPGSVTAPVISADGSAVAVASKCYTGNPATIGVAVYSVDLGTFEAITTSGAGNTQRELAISADGRVVAFVTREALAAEDTDGQDDVYLYDRLTLQYQLVTGGSYPVGSGSFKTFYIPEQAFGGQNRYFIFETNAGGVSPQDNNTQFDVFMLDRLTDTISRVSMDASGQSGTHSLASSLSLDGTMVAMSGNFRINGTYAGAGYYVKELSTQAFTFLAARHPNDSELATSVSADGGVVAFLTRTALLPDDTNNAGDIYAWKRSAGNMTRLTVGLGGIEPPNDQWAPRGVSMAANAPYLAFRSAVGLLGGDMASAPANGADIFVVRLP